MDNMIPIGLIFTHHYSTDGGELSVHRVLEIVNGRYYCEQIDSNKNDAQKQWTGSEGAIIHYCLYSIWPHEFPQKMPLICKHTIDDFDL